jgi:hypothetical protein
VRAWTKVEGWRVKKVDDKVQEDDMRQPNVSPQSREVSGRLRYIETLGISAQPFGNSQTCG